MRALIWVALGLACAGYWWFETRRKPVARTDWTYGEEDARDTAEFVEKWIEKTR